MISLLKAPFPGALLTWIVSLFIGSGGSRGGFLVIHQITIVDVSFYWSWPLFFVSTALAFALFTMMK
jgi:hypothetical protein